MTYNIKQMSADSRRVLAAYKLRKAFRKFPNTWTFFFLMLLAYPFFALFRAANRADKDINLIGLVVIVGCVIAPALFT